MAVASYNMTSIYTKMCVKHVSNLQNIGVNALVLQVENLCFLKYNVDLNLLSAIKQSR